MLLKVASSYRTVSAIALQVITGIPPIDLQVQERRNLSIANGDKREARKEERQATIRNWQTMWEENVLKAQWTKTLIPDIRPWIECKHRVTNYYLTQILTGHGSFFTYLKRFGKIDTDVACTVDNKTQLHTHFSTAHAGNEEDRTHIGRWGMF